MDKGTWQATVCVVTRVRHDLVSKVLLWNYGDPEMNTKKNIWKEYIKHPLGWLLSKTGREG